MGNQSFKRTDTRSVMTGSARPRRCFGLPEALALLVLATASMTSTTVWAVSFTPVPTQFRDRAVFDAAIAHAAGIPLEPKAVSGITVPHHLLAADLIAQAFRMTDPKGIDKVIVLFPDHYKKTKLPFATTRKAFDTAFGRRPYA